MSICKCVLLAISLLTTAITIHAQPKAGALKIKPYTFENGKGEKVASEFGTLLVPENRSDPQSNLIELAFVRFKSTAKTPGPPIVYLAGGPGGSGIGTARGSRFPLFMALREIGDVIAFDQRGTGFSKPNLTCLNRLALPLDVAPTREAAIKELRENASDCAFYWHNVQRVDLTGYNTNESADDLEDLRKALGVEQISLWSISYGTHLAFATIRRHPQSIHRVPVLFISGTLDARTPISNAAEYLTGFSNSTHMIIEGAVHSDPLFLSSPKIKEGMMEFLRGQPVTVTKITAAPMKFVL